MNETIRLTVQSLCIIIVLCIACGTMAGLYLMGVYVRARGIKTKSQKEMKRLANWISRHHPEAVREASPVDVAIDLIKQPLTQEKWKLE